MNFTISIPNEYLALCAMIAMSFATCNQVAIDDPVPAPAYVIQYDPFAAICAAEERSDSLAAVFDSTLKTVKNVKLYSRSAKVPELRPLVIDTTRIIRISPHFGERNKK